jgi:hypothetical protein
MCERETGRVKSGVGSINREHKERNIGLWWVYACCKM